MSGTIQQTRPATLKRYFVGYSTQDSLRTGVRTLYDIDLINIDLANAFNTRVGERVMRPDYGCKLWDYLMEPLTDGMRDRIVQEAIRICELDSRLTVQEVNVTQANAGFQISIILLYTPWNVISTFQAAFENADTVYFGNSLQ